MYTSTLYKYFKIENCLKNKEVMIGKSTLLPKMEIIGLQSI